MLCVKHTPGLQEIKRQECMQDTASLFGPFSDDSSTSDIVVMAEEAKIHAHKIVLSAQSSLFKAMFQVMLQNATSAFVCFCSTQANVMHYADWHKGEHSSRSRNG